MKKPVPNPCLKDVIIAVDFDGTCVEHEFPFIGKTTGMEYVLKYMHDNGAKLILFTMRSGTSLQNAVAWFQFLKIPLFGINENPEQKKWTASPKPYAHAYIDDAAVGVPLVYPVGRRPYVDPKAIQKWAETFRG